MTTNYVKRLLGTDRVRKSKGIFKMWVSYYYHLGLTTDKLVNQVTSSITGAVIVASGDHYHTFCGSAKDGSAKDSYLWVTFTVPTKA